MALTAAERRERIEKAEAFCKQSEDAWHGVTLCVDRIAWASKEAEWLDQLAADTPTADIAAALRKTAGRFRSIASRCESRKEMHTQRQQAVKDALDTMPRQDYARLLSLRYVERMGWEQVADALCYTAHHTRGYLRRAALLSLYEVMPDAWR